MEMSAEGGWYPAPGKLNLFLHVLGRRADGYHELQTVFRLIDAADRIRIRRREDGAIRRCGFQVENDLCVRAAELLQRHAGLGKGCDIELEKLLPVGGGLGGGSSDAATVLLVLNRLWGLGLGRERLMALGLQLGADLPFFLFGRNALGEGMGERLRELSLPPAWYLVLMPQVAVSTREIFKALTLTPGGKRLKIPPFFSGQGCNDLEPVVAARYPEVARHLNWLRSRSPAARMSGSGASVFAEFDTEEEARAVHSGLPAAMRGFVARGLERHPLCDWAD
jgi:4-diphosphocytidyl-2-C-methyl-D-erythritol kinase